MVNNITIIKALEPFLSKPNEKLHLAMISREIKVPHPTLRKWLNAFEKNGILKKSFQGRLTLYSLNHNNPNLIDYLVMAEKDKLIRFCEKYLQLKEIVKFVHEAFREDTKVLIFGSAVLSFKNANDIDILVTGKIDEYMIKDISKKLNKEIHLLNVDKLNDITLTLKKEIIQKHLIIKDSENIISWMLW